MAMSQDERRRRWRVYANKYRALNLEKVDAKDRAYREENADHIKLRRRRYREEHRESIREYNRKWNRSEKGRAYYKARKHIRRGAGGTFTAEDIKDLYATQGGSCYYCSVDIEGGYHIEHMTPLSRGGRNDVSNICLACAPCNLSKHTKTAEEFQRGCE